ncbi:uncharacterized protein C8A04DRAFT_39159 [Dichotomopilus funicola]|uniref:DUF1993 domain-containing protein n=1 Tax=Dichotomopilus funicola TaxID=1934379 RepID=A0AAN6UYE9_9PEZI|nr:hypothetical protein C8A04DRAFT_39159 [Dichotomopilus funicola]
MSLSIYDATIGTSTRAVLTLLDLVKLAQAHPKGEALASARLADDMLPFTTQIIIVTNFAKKYVERLARRELPVWEDNETTLEQCVARIEKTLDLLKTVSREDVEGAAVNEVNIKMGKAGNADVTTKQYVLDYAFPNIYFHLTTAYDILRKEGLELGKAVYIQQFVSEWNFKQ